MVLAGAQSQVMSLWQVADRPTRELMVDYYKGLQQHQGRSESLRNVQLRMLRSRDRQHPYYWAAFIASAVGQPGRETVGTADLRPPDDGASNAEVDTREVSEPPSAAI